MHHLGEMIKKNDLACVHNLIVQTTYDVSPNSKLLNDNMICTRC